MKKIIIASLLALALFLGTVSYCNPATSPPISSALVHWRQLTRYTGDVCLLSSPEKLDARGVVKCDNGVQATTVSINAGMAFMAWDACRHGEKFACIYTADK